MKNTIVLLAIFSSLSLVACDKTPDTILESSPMSSDNIDATGQSGEEAIQDEPGKTGVGEVQVEPVKPGVDTTIIRTPPIVEMPAEIVPEPSSEALAN